MFCVYLRRMSILWLLGEWFHRYPLGLFNLIFPCWYSVYFFYHFLNMGHYSLQLLLLTLSPFNSVHLPHDFWGPDSINECCLCYFFYINISIYEIGIFKFEITFTSFLIFFLYISIIVYCLFRMKDSLSISCRADLLAKNSLSFCLSECLNFPSIFCRLYWGINDMK